MTVAAAAWWSLRLENLWHDALQAMEESSRERKANRCDKRSLLEYFPSTASRERSRKSEGCEKTVCNPSRNTLWHRHVDKVSCFSSTSVFHSLDGGRLRTRVTRLVEFHGKQEETLNRLDALTHLGGLCMFRRF